MSGEPTIEDRVIKEEGLNTAKSSRTKKVEYGVCHKIIYHKNLLRHIISVHERIKPFQCEKCASSFAEKSTLDKHIASIHEVENNIALNHEGTKPYECDTCSTSFSQKESMLRHVATVHEGKKPFQCETCVSSFAEKRRLNEH